MLLFEAISTPHSFGAFDLDPDAFSPFGSCRLKMNSDELSTVLCISAVCNLFCRGFPADVELQRERDRASAVSTIISDTFILCSHFISSPNHGCLVFLDGSQDALKAY